MGEIALGKGAKVGAHANRLPPLWVTQIEIKNKSTKTKRRKYTNYTKKLGKRAKAHGNRLPSLWVTD